MNDTKVGTLIGADRSLPSLALLGRLELIRVDWGIGIMRRSGSYHFVSDGSNMLNRTSTTVLKLNQDGTFPEGDD